MPQPKIAPVILKSLPPPAVQPEFFPLPQRGQDPYFGIGRSSYYALEAGGLLTLIRLRKPGNQRGRVLVSYARMSELMQRFVADAEVAAQKKAAARNAKTAAPSGAVSTG